MVGVSGTPTATVPALLTSYLLDTCQAPCGESIATEGGADKRQVSMDVVGGGWLVVKVVIWDLFDRKDLGPVRSTCRGALDCITTASGEPCRIVLCCIRLNCAGLRTVPGFVPGLSLVGLRNALDRGLWRTTLCCRGVLCWAVLCWAPHSAADIGHWHQARQCRLRDCLT